MAKGYIMKYLKTAKRILWFLLQLVIIPTIEITVFIYKYICDVWDVSSFDNAKKYAKEYDKLTKSISESYCLGSRSQHYEYPGNKLNPTNGNKQK